MLPLEVPFAKPVPRSHPTYVAGGSCWPPLGPLCPRPSWTDSEVRLWSGHWLRPGSLSPAVLYDFQQFWGVFPLENFHFPNEGMDLFRTQKHTCPQGPPSRPKGAQDAECGPRGDLGCVSGSWQPSPLAAESPLWVGEAGRQGEGLHVFQEELKIWIFMFSFLMFSILASL